MPKTVDRALPLAALAIEEIVYPDSDGQGMPDGDPQREAMIMILQILEQFFEARNDVYISGNNFVYYIEGDPTKVFSPDVMVAKGVRKGPRDNYKLWEEHDHAPDFILEIAAKTTFDKDLNRNKGLYRLLGVKEYFLFDHTGGKYFKPPLQAFRLVNGQWESVLKGYRARSEELGLEFRLIRRELQIFNAATGERLLPPLQALQREREARRQEAEARLQAEKRAAELEAELERLRGRKN